MEGQEPPGGKREGGRWVSEDGRWWWDGDRWRAVAGGVEPDMAVPQGSHQDAAGRWVSDDGLWWWDGSEWRLVERWRLVTKPRSRRAWVGLGGVLVAGLGFSGLVWYWGYDSCMVHDCGGGGDGYAIVWLFAMAAAGAGVAGYCYRFLRRRQSL